MDEQSSAHGHGVQIKVNEQSVTLTGPKVTGVQIKEAAIAQGVNIGVDFQLSQELPNGRRQIVGDNDRITVNKNSVFDAVAGDDNS